MQFKHRSLAIAAALATCVAAPVFAQDGTINFTGEIVNSPCTISPGSQNMVVPLGKVATSAFPGGAAGAKSPPAKFTIDLLGCPVGTAQPATVTFNGLSHVDNAALLQVSNSGQVNVPAATGVAVELADSTGTAIALGAESVGYALGAGDNSLQFQAWYTSLGGAISPGVANAVAEFTVNYK